MAGQPGSASSLVPAAAHVVGNAFVNQYYNVLHQSPQVVHRFYTDESRLTHAEAGADGAVETVVTQSAIHDKVMSLDYCDFKAEIVTVDSLESFNGGVLVMVTGSLSDKASRKRNFVQSFFLAPQEKGYFVLNDIFRYLDEEPQSVKQMVSLPNGIREPPSQAQVPESVSEPSLPVEHEVREEPSPPSVEEDTVVEEIFDLPEQVEISEAEEDTLTEDMGRVDVTSPVIDEPVSPLAEPVQAAPLEETSGEMPKKSYASILRLMKENAGVAPVPTHNAAPKAGSAATERMASSPAFPSAVSAASVGQDVLDEGVPSENEADSRSVYVKNLPPTVTATQLEEEFRSKFGAVKANGVMVKYPKQQGVCYAFVEFEAAFSAIAAIEASPVSLVGRQVYIEEKRPTGSRGVSRSSRAPGVGGRGERAFRPEGIRGRGPFVGRGGGVARGLGQDRERDSMNRGRGTGASRGNYGGGSNNNFAGSAGPTGNFGGSENYRPQGNNVNRAARRGGASNANQAPRNGNGSRGGTPPATTA